MKSRKGMARGRTHIAAIYRALNKAYGPLPHISKEPPVDILIRTILSQNTSDINSERAYQALRRQYPRWTDVLTSSPRDIAPAIRCGGLADIKANRICQTLDRIYQREGRISLNHLKNNSRADALTYLTSLPGVGIKTACCVLLFGFRQPVMPVDTHIYRIAGRLGWISRDMPVDHVHSVLESMIPGRRILPLHLYLIEHGRCVCRARRPLCGGCLIARYCSRIGISKR